MAKVLRKHFREALTSILPAFVEDRRGASTGLLWTDGDKSQLRLYAQILFHPRMDAFTVQLIVNNVDESLVVPEYIEPAEASSKPMARVALFRFWDVTPGADPWYWKLSGLSQLEGLAHFLLNEPTEEEASKELLAKATQAIEALRRYAVPFFDGIKSPR